LSTEELQRYASGSAAASSEPPRARVNAAVRGSWQQQQQRQRVLHNQQDNSRLEQQHGSAFYQQQRQHQQQFAAPGSSLPAPAAPSAAAANPSWVQNIAKDVISQPGSRSFLHSSSIDQIGGSAGSSVDNDGSNMSDSDLADLNPCLATWSGAFESDSMDETEVCTDSELLEAALLQRQRQQRREQQQLSLYTGNCPVYEVLLESEDERQEGMEPQVQGNAAHDTAGGSSNSSNSSSNSSSSSTTRGVAVGDQAGDAGPDGVVSDVSSSSSSSNSQQQPKAPASGQQQQRGLLSGASSATTTTTSSSSSSHAYQQQLQQQQQPQAPDGYLALPPKHLRGHIIISGCASSFVQFAQQLHSLASPSASPLPLVILHTELPPREVIAAISSLGPVYFVRGKSSESAALAAAGAENARWEGCSDSLHLYVPVCLAACLLLRLWPHC
jgi:hypothetical protein